MAASQRPTKRMESRCTPAAERATLAFEIIGYSKHKGMGTGKCIQSNHASVGGYEWCICYYPDGSKEAVKDYVSVFIKLLGEGPKVRALYDLRLVNQDSGLSSSVFSCLKSPAEFNPLDKNSWGQFNFKDRSGLEQSAYLRGDRLIIECDLTVLKEPLVAKTVEVQVPPSDLSDNFGKLLETGEKADVTFKVKGEVFRVHKIVLATRSPVFKAELYGPTGDKRRRNITVQDMQPAIFKALIHFIYTDSLPSMDNLHGDDNKEIVKHLLVAADRYAMERMKIECEGILSKSLDVGTLATTLTLADQHHCCSLIDACVEFIISSNRMDDVLASQGCEHLKKSFPAVLVDVLERATKSRKNASTLCPLLPSPIAPASDPNPTPPHPTAPAMAALQRPTKRIESRCTPTMEQATLAFEIIGYSQHKGMGTGKFIKSTPVSVGGYEFCIFYYPDGVEEEAKDYVSVFIKLLGKGPMVRALYDLRLVNQDSGLSSSVISCLKSPVEFNPHDQTKSWGQTYFKKRSVLEQSPYLRDERLIIECDLTVFKEPLVTKAVEVQIPPSDLSDNFGKLLETAEKADLTFKVKGEVFRVHKIVLATRSPVFKAELYGPMRDKERRNITVQDMQPAVFKALLHFIYTDSLPSMDNLDGDDDKEMVKHLLVSADRYAIERFKMICEDILCKSLDVETVATTLALADQRHCSSLKDACVEFVTSSNRMDDVVATQGYVDLKRSCPDVLVDVLERAAKSRKI